MQYNVTRKAILIGSPGGEGNAYLPGVRADIQVFSEYLFSARGGCWHSQEIIVLNNPTAEQVLALTQMATVDYLLVYFSGHGYTDGYGGQRMLCCKHNVSIADISLLQGPSPRIQLISDACRNFIGDGIGSIPLLDEQYFNFIGEPSAIRRVFDEYIIASPAGKSIIHGTRSGMSAADSSGGGHFTQSLLHVAGRMTVDSGFQLAVMEQVLYHVRPLLKSKGNNQEPEIIHYSGALHVPFSVAMPLPIIEDTADVRLTVKHVPKDWGQVLLGLGLFAAAVYLADD